MLHARYYSVLPGRWDTVAGQSRTTEIQPRQRVSGSPGALPTSVDDTVHDDLHDLEDDLHDNQYDDNPLELGRVRVVQFGREHIEELLDDVEPLVEHLRPSVDLKVLGGAQVEREPLVVLPEELRVVEDVRVQVDGRTVNKKLADAFGDGRALEADLTVDGHALGDHPRLLDGLLDRPLEDAKLDGLSQGE